jgi:hypothetical protein
MDVVLYLLAVTGLFAMLALLAIQYGADSRDDFGDGFGRPARG